MNILQTTYLLLLSLLLFNVNTQNQSFTHYINDVNTHEISSIGPPRELSLEITCDLLRPCIKASWLPPINYQLDPIQQQNIKYNQHALIAYRLRYRIMHPIELTHVNVYHRKLNTTEFNNKLLSKIIEKNITDLQYTTNPGEHLFGVIYEVSVAAITKNGYGQETTGRIATPEAAPSDAPSNFRVVGGDQTSVQLAWDPPRLLYRNGIITKYQVRCYVVGAEENHDELKTLTEQTLKLTNLPAATHACLVRAWTKAGPGPWSDRIQFIINQKVPLPPINIHVYWKTQYMLTVEWTLPDDDTNLAYLIVHYATQTKPNVWHKYFVKDFKTTQDLNNLDPNEEYLIRLSSVDVNGNEGESSDIVSIHSYKHSLMTTTNNNNDRKHTNFIYMDIPDQPEKFTVQNFQCIKKTINTILIEWLPPIHLANLLEYKLHISGRSEFITSSGVLKSVHLGDIQLHQSVDQQIDNNQLQMLNWQLTDMIDSLSQLDNHQHHQRQQLTHKMQIPNLKPNSQYKITIRPIYRALITEGNIGTKEGIPVTILCHTEWSAPEYIRPPELLAIYSGPPDPYGPTSIIEVKLYRVSEENGPLHNYYVIVSPELETITLNQNTINNIPMKSINSFSIDASQYDLISLSQNNDLPSNQAPYLALARYTMNLFEPNHEISIVILGSEEIDNFILRNQYYLNPIVSRNQTFDKNTKKLNDIDSYFDDDKFDKNESNLNNKISEYNTYYYNHNSNMLTKSIQVNNKRLFQSTVYRVALRACSQYPNGQQLCSTSHWSEKISPITSIKSNLISSKLKSFKDKITSWNLHKSSSSSSSSSPSSSSATASSLPIIFISLASCLIFFIILSTILGCILKCRKQQFNRTLNNQYDVPICHNLNKSIINDNLSINSPIKSYLSNKTSNNSNNNNNNNLMKSQLSNYVLNIPNDDTQSPSNSSYGLSYSSTNGITSLNKSINQLSINNHITSTINKSMYLMNKDKNQQIKHDKMHIIDHFNQFVHDGTLELHRIPIPIEQFHEVIYQSRNNNYISLQHEFHTIEQISSTQYISTVHSNLDVNKSKNRYPNILAYDCTRVLLQLDSHQQYQSVEQSETLLGLDYINANYIDGYRKQKVYIATQAPLPNTFNSFWTMIWEQNTSVIVMLTKIIENGEVKCDQYWPNHGVLTFSDITVTHLETNELANYVMRSFEIRKDNEHRKIWHLQYTSWPDQEVPTYSTVFLMFLRRVGAITPNDCGPIVVHCSSGTGRTGVYIAISILLERMKTESVIDIFGLVNQLHMQRNYMIETQEQYQFIYTALYESITDGNTEVSARNLYTHLQHLSMLQTINTTNDYIGQLNNHLLTSLSTTSANNSINELSNLGGCNTMMTTSTTTTTTTIATTTTTSTTMPITNSLGITGFQLEFRKINKLSPNINFIQSKTGFVGYTPPGSPIHGYKLAVSCDVAKQSVNLSKNRLVSIVPFDWNRVTLCSIRGVNGSDYINASLIDGYLKKNAYIACQGPMISTVEDFWRMVWEKHSCLIVMLCSVKESGKEKCFTYWPEDKPSRYQFFVVDLTAQYTMSSHILREFKVTDTRDGESRTVRQLQYIRWNEQGLPQTSESLIDLIGHVHKTKEQYNYDGPITVHCSSGSGRTGLFITMCNVLERLRQESVVDMYQTVKLLRQQRVWMIQTEEQYRFCYTTTLDYLNSFDLCTQPQLLIQTNNNLQMNSPNLKIKMKSSHHLSDKTVLFELDKNYELRNHVVFK